MKNHCAYCHGKFGLVRHRRAFKSFCSQKCVDHYKAWLRADVGKRKGWSDCLRGTSKNRSYSSDATKLSANDSASFPVRFMDVHARAAPRSAWRAIFRGALRSVSLSVVPYALRP